MTHFLCQKSNQPTIQIHRYDSVAGQQLPCLAAQPGPGQAAGALLWSWKKKQGYSCPPQRQTPTQLGILAGCTSQPRALWGLCSSPTTLLMSVCVGGGGGPTRLGNLSFPCSLSGAYLLLRPSPTLERTALGGCQAMPPSSASLPNNSGGGGVSRLPMRDEGPSAGRGSLLHIRTASATGQTQRRAHTPSVQEPAEQRVRERENGHLQRSPWGLPGYLGYLLPPPNPDPDKPAVHLASQNQIQAEQLF